MTEKGYFEVKEKFRRNVIKMNILGMLSKEEKKLEKSRVEKIINEYEGRDRDALSVLAYAAERSRYGEFAEKLERHYGENLAYVHPGARKLKKIPGAVRATIFFLNCYKELGIKPQQ